ncbi:MAG: SPOR domain-containing protein [Methyloceanibacter sp.]
MADNRKPFRPRRVAFGGRFLPRGLLLGAALALLGAPVHAQDAGLKSGTASLASGNYDSAVRQLSATVNSEDASETQAAQALYLRGIAYRKLGQPGRAISDLGAAIWLGLPASDRVRALVNRGLAFRSTGLSSQAEDELSKARKAGSSSEVEKLISEDGGGSAAVAAFATEVSPNAGYETESSALRARPAPTPAPSTPRTAEGAPSGGWSASVSDGSEPPPSEGGNRVSRWFGSLTDSISSSGKSAPPPAPEPPAAAIPSEQVPRERAAAATPPSASSWASNTQTERAVTDAAPSGGGGAIGRWFSRSDDTPAVAPSPSAASGGAYTVQLANSRSEAEAKALWQKVRGTSEIASAQPRIEKIDIGDFGTFYSLKIGPFADRAQSAKVCNALKRNGTDCSVVSPEGS